MDASCMSNLNESVFQVLDYLQTREALVVPSPPECQKRASVALILAFHRPKEGEGTPSSSWIDVGHQGRTSEAIADVRARRVTGEEPHILFIRRAARDGDRWSSHVALPGGKKESDESDREAAIRETMEEVGLDISPHHAIPVSGLDQRLVTTSFGTRKLLTLCPYVFLLKEIGLPPLRLQASEVASAHWVPISTLLDPGNRTKERVDVSSRLSGRPTGSRRTLLKWLCGDMLFAGIDMIPSVLSRGTGQSHLQSDGAVQSSREDRLVLWGLTFGVIIDFLDLLPFPGTFRSFWDFPTFSALDLKCFLWLLNMPGRANLSTIARDTGSRNHSSIECGNVHETKVGVMDFTGVAVQNYYSLIRPAIFMTLGFRIAAVMGVAAVTRRAWNGR